MLTHDLHLNFQENHSCQSHPQKKYIVFDHLHLLLLIDTLYFLELHYQNLINKSSRILFIPHKFFYLISQFITNRISDVMKYKQLLGIVSHFQFDFRLLNTFISNGQTTLKQITEKKTRKVVGSCCIKLLMKIF